MNQQGSLLKRNQDFIQFLARLNHKERSKIISNLGGKYVNTISEIFKNFLKKNLTTDINIIKKLKPYKKEITNIVLKSTPIYKKKKILQNRRGGAILSVLLPLAVSLVSTLFKK